MSKRDRSALFTPDLSVTKKGRKNINAGEKYILILRISPSICEGGSGGTFNEQILNLNYVLSDLKFLINFMRITKRPKFDCTQSRVWIGWGWDEIVKKT